MFGSNCSFVYIRKQIFLMHSTWTHRIFVVIRIFGEILNLNFRLANIQITDESVDSAISLFSPGAGDRLHVRIVCCVQFAIPNWHRHWIADFSHSRKMEMRFKFIRAKCQSEALVAGFSFEAKWRRMKNYLPVKVWSKSRFRHVSGPSLVHYQGHNQALAQFKPLTMILSHSQVSV